MHAIAWNGVTWFDYGIFRGQTGGSGGSGGTGYTGHTGGSGGSGGSGSTGGSGRQGLPFSVKEYFESFTEQTKLNIESNG